MNEIESIEGYAEVQIVDEGWSKDEAGLPVFHAASIDLIESELVGLRSDEGEYKLRLAAVLTEATDRSFYGDSTLKKVCKANQIVPSTGYRIVSGYKRLRNLPEEDRAQIVAALQSGELFWTKTEIAAPVKDNQEYVELMHASADGSLSNAKLRKRVKSLTGEDVGSVADEDEDADAEEDTSEDYDVDVPQEADHATQMVRFITGVTEIATQLEAAGGVKDMPLESIPDELATLVKMLRRWHDQQKRMVSERS